uniref:Uncharacterized protein n=1 Tax=Eutreptiella gymnastica TaxID=73025 RepID=A0A7S1IMF8_9EUGL
MCGSVLVSLHFCVCLCCGTWFCLLCLSFEDTVLHGWSAAVAWAGIGQLLGCASQDVMHDCSAWQDSCLPWTYRISAVLLPPSHSTRISSSLAKQLHPYPTCLQGVASGREEWEGAFAVIVHSGMQSSARDSGSSSKSAGNVTFNVWDMMHLRHEGLWHTCPPSLHAMRLS